MTITDTAEAVDLTVWDQPRDPAWLGLGARFQEHVQRLARRSDVTVRVRPDMTDQQPTAWFIPALARIEMNARMIWDREDGDHPDYIDPNYAEDRAVWPHMMGLAAHEAAHAAHTRLEFPAGCDRAAAQWAVVLEEPRIEAALVRRRPQERLWLRASAVLLIAANKGTVKPPQESRAQMVHTATLLIGRAHGGVLSWSEVEPLVQTLRDGLGDDYVEVDAVLTEAVTADDGDIEHLLQLGARLAEVAREDADDDGSPDGGQGSGEGSDGEQGDDAPAGGGAPDGNADGEAMQMPCGSWTEGDLPENIDPDTGTGEADDDAEGGSGNASDLEKIADEIARQVSEDATDEADNSQHHPKATAPPVDMKEEAEHRDSKKHADRVFGCGTSSPPITLSHRSASPALQRETRTLTDTLRRAQFRDISRTHVASVSPPGRMRMGELMRRDAQRASRARITAQPWRQTRRREVERPPLTVGFSGDVSGSMEQWQAAVADMAWATAHAVKNLDGTAAAVAWDTKVASTLQPGTAPPKVTEADCRGGSTGCPASLRALDGALNLTRGHGARVVVVVTDGAIGGKDECAQIIERMARTGVKVLWVTMRPDPISPYATNVVLDSPDRFGQVIGQALADLLAQT